MGIFDFLFKKKNVLRIPEEWKQGDVEIEVIGRVKTRGGRTELVVPSSESYRIDIVDGSKTITCLVCQMTSHHPKDVEHLYCGNCHKFHERKKFQ
jgi:hypothetical protein